MINVDTELDRQGVTRLVVQNRSLVQETVTMTATTPMSRRMRFVGISPDKWGWEEIRDYVVAEIEKRFGPFPRDTKKEYGIFMSFKGRWQDKAGLIAKHAFEIEDGRWAGAPMSVNRFCKNSDPFFAAPIVQRIGG